MNDPSSSGEDEYKTPALLKKSDSLVLEEITVEIGPRRSLFSLELKDLWHYRELLFFLTWRDIKVRYKQTVLGVAWAILQPFLTMVIFSFIFGNLANLPSEGIPYPIFTYTALLPWQLFAFALTSASNSLIMSQSLITKVYFPRLIIPLASILTGVVDFFFAFIVLMGMMIYYKIPLTWRILTVPAFILLAIITALAVGLWLSAMNVKYRDVRQMVPFLTRFWEYATPIAYSITLIPEKWQVIYSLNPMTGVVEGFRWALLGKTVSVGPLVIISIVIVVMLLASGLVYFRHMEDEFADVI
jgi:lipopolysaccharide transport system permease protein